MAGPYSNSDRDRILAAVDLVSLIAEHVRLRPQGREHIGLCPFHDDSSPSMHVVTHKGNAFYKCFACGAAGNAIDFVMNLHRLDFPEALRTLAQRCGIALAERSDHRPTGEPTRTDLHEANSYALKCFRRWLADPKLGNSGRRVLVERGIPTESLDQFMLGVAPDGWDFLLQQLRRDRKDWKVFEAAGLLKSRRDGDGWYDAFRNRVMFPIFDEFGNPIAFGARKINPDDDPKYLNSSDSAVFSKSRSLYGIHLARKSILDQKTAIVTEGYTDVIACHRAGITNVVATLGTALTREHARILKRLCTTVILLFDGDEAGQRAADRAIEVFFNETIDVKICTLPDGMDPDELLGIPEGTARFHQALAESLEILPFMMRRFALGYRAAGGLSARQQRLESLLDHLTTLGFNDMPGVRRSLVISAIADQCGLSAADVDASARSRRSGPSTPQRSTPIQPSPRPAEESDTNCSRARSVAERRLLGDLLAFPTLICECVDVGEGHWLPILEAIPPSALRIERHRRIAEVLSELADRGEPVLVQTVMSGLASGPARDLVSTLYLEGLDRLNDTMTEPVHELRSAYADLDGLDRREAVRAHLSSSPRHTSQEEDSLVRIREGLDLIRRRGTDQTAIARRLRS